jgi:hypothetical protein
MAVNSPACLSHEAGSCLRRDSELSPDLSSGNSGLATTARYYSEGGAGTSRGKIKPLLWYQISSCGNQDMSRPYKDVNEGAHIG